MGLVVIAGFMLLSGCSSFLPSSGPSRVAVEHNEKSYDDFGVIVMDVTPDVAKRLIDNQQKDSFASVFVDCPREGMIVGPGDVLEVTIWETPPATLFFNALSENGASAVHAGMAPMRFPEQQVNSEGTISVPFAGHIRVANLTLTQIEKDICSRLKGKANDPQVLVRIIKNVSSTATVVGEVSSSSVVPLTPKCERILDILAVAGGAKQPVNKLTIQLTRGGVVFSVPLEKVIKDVKENLIVEPRDVITVLYKPLSFTALGATGKNAEIEFESTGISLAQALARSGGVIDDRADAQGVFIFRFEPLSAMNWPQKPQVVTAEKTVPVVYKVNLRDPITFFAAQSFPIRDKDVLFVSNAPSVQLVKFMQIISTLVTPATSTLSTTSQVETLVKPVN